MKITCNQKDLSAAINVVQKAVSARTTLPILEGILLEAYNGTLKLTGNDLNIGIEKKIDIEIDQPGAVVISSRLFGEIVRKLPPSEVSLSLEDNQLKIICEKSKFVLTGQDPLQFPELPSVTNDNALSMDKELFNSMIKQTIFAISQDENRPILTGSLIELKDGILTIVSIDGKRLALRNATIDSTSDFKMVVPAKALNEVNKIIASSNKDDSDFTILSTDKHILFEVDDIKVVSRLLEGEFIKYSQMFPTEFKTSVEVNTDELLHSVERASLLAREGKNGAIKLAVKENLIEITSNAEIGSVNESVTVDMSGNELEIGFNPRYISEALKVIDSEKVILKFITGVSPCIIKPADNDNFTYLVVPVRMAN